METRPHKKRPKLVEALIETFGFSPAWASLTAVCLIVVCVLALAWVVQSAPPRQIVITSGPEGSSFQRWASSYQRELQKHGVKLEVRPSAGASENLERLKAPESGVDLGFLPGGLEKPANLDGLMSLGSIAYQPIWIYYRSPVKLELLSELAGKRIAVGAPGSGTRTIALSLLQANGITGEPTVFSEFEADEAAAQFQAGNLDAVFLMGDSASLQTLRTLGRSPDVRLYSFQQADAYVRRNSHLSKLHLPQGSFDLGRNLPEDDVVMLGTTIELVTREGLNPALSDLLLEVAAIVHGRAGLLNRRGEFPAAIERDLPLSEDAVRYYKHGKGFFRRTIRSFWLASVLNRVLVAVVPLILVAIPAMKLLPVAYRLSVQLRLYRYYRPLLRLERETFGPMTSVRARELLQQLDEIEGHVSRLNVPASFADRYYWLESHIALVRGRLDAAIARASAA